MTISAEVKEERKRTESLSAAEEKKDLETLKKTLDREQRVLRFRRFTRNRMAVAGFIIVCLVTLAALAAPLICRYDPLELDTVNRLKPCSAEHWFGTDSMGRDLFSRVIYGARISLFVGSTVSLFSGSLGMVLGLYASVNKLADSIIMRICDGLKAIPSTLLAITLMAVLGADIRNVIIALTVVNVPNMARLARGRALIVREMTYIEAMRCLGAGKTRILWKHMAPNIISPMIVQITFVFASSIITEAALSFLGAGVPAPAPSWGSILNDGKAVIYTAWWTVFFPGFFTAITVLGLNLFGDGIRDFIDPTSAG